MMIGGTLGYNLLCRIAPPDSPALAKHRNPAEHAEAPHSVLERLWTAEDWHAITGKAVLDYGCGVGGDAIAMAQRGAGRVVGIDVVAWKVAQARRHAKAVSTAQFLLSVELPTIPSFDVITCTDVFEHLADPTAELVRMAALLRPGGHVFLDFNPPWYHPSGAHSFNQDLFPWSHLLFTEAAMTRWRRDLTPGHTGTTYGDFGLNRMTVARFQRLIAASPLRAVRLELIPIRALRHLHNALTRELLTSTVRCRLVPR